jgi:hypothetical protein
LRPPWPAGDEYNRETGLFFLYRKRLPDFKISCAIITILYKVEKNLTRDFSSAAVNSWHHEKIYM